MVAYLCLTGCLPFDDDFSEQEIARQTIYELTPFPQSTWFRFTEEAKDCIDSKVVFNNIILELLDKNPSTRLNIFELLDHPWINKYKLIKMLEK